MAEEDFALSEAIARRRSCRAFSPAPIKADALRRLLWAAQGTTDDAGNRTVPSAHGLHPVRLLVSTGNVEQYSTGLFEVGAGGMSACIREGDVKAELEKCAINEQPWIGGAAGVITICADFLAPAREFAEQPPYGVRGGRYVYIEAGAAAQNLALQAVSEQLGCILVAGSHDEATADVLKLEPPYRPVLHLCLGVPASA